MSEAGAVDLSIAMASYNTCDLVRQCIESIYATAQGISFEVIVVDNASVDGTQEMVERDFGDVKLIANAENVGVAAATNQGIEVSRGRYFMTINSDVVMKPGALAELVEFMDAHPDVGAAAARLVRPDGGEHPPVCGNLPSLRLELFDALSMLSSAFCSLAARTRGGTDLDYTRTQQVACVWWGTAFIVRREVIETVGPQDPLFFVYSEDVDWAMRIARAGWKLYYVAEAEIIHYGGQSTKQASAKMQGYLWKSKCRLIRKHYGLASALVLKGTVVGACLVQIVKWIPLHWAPRGLSEKSRHRVAVAWNILKAVAAG